MTIQVKLTRVENATHYGVSVGDTIEINLEAYVFGVVASEVSNAHIEVCKAQAVAARTKAMSYIEKGKPISDTSSKAQAFRASRMDATTYPTTKAAVDATAGEVLTYGNRILDTCAFSANNGGQTTSSEERWGGYRAYLIEQDDPWDLAATGGKKTGHGVGMSQAGAKYAAMLGIRYMDILAFYYPGTQVAPVYAKEGNCGMTSQDLINEFQ